MCTPVKFQDTGHEEKKKKTLAKYSTSWNQKSSGFSPATVKAWRWQSNALKKMVQIQISVPSQSVCKTYIKCLQTFKFPKISPPISVFSGILEIKSGKRKTQKRGTRRGNGLEDKRDARMMEKGDPKMRAIHQPGDPAFQTDHGRSFCKAFLQKGRMEVMLVSLTVLRGTFDN